MIRLALAPTLVLAIALGGCSDNDSDDNVPAGEVTPPTEETGDPDTPDPDDAPEGGVSGPIVGDWARTDPGTQCPETFAFESDGTYVYTSLDAVEGGSYSLVQQGETVLMLQVTEDNGLANCSGESVDATGLVLGNAVTFPDEDTMVLGYEEDGDELQTFTRQ